MAKVDTSTMTPTERRLANLKNGRIAQAYVSATVVSLVRARVEDTDEPGLFTFRQGQSDASVAIAVNNKNLKRQNGQVMTGKFTVDDVVRIRAGQGWLLADEIKAKSATAPSSRRDIANLMIEIDRLGKRVQTLEDMLTDPKTSSMHANGLQKN